MGNLLNEFLVKCHSKKARIYCFGDAMIDEYVEVKVTRISQEQAVPIMLHSGKITKKPGGCANVAFQLKHTYSDVSLFTLNDPEAYKVFNEHKITSYPLGDIAKLPLKTRYLENGFQVARLDTEFENCNLQSESIEKCVQEIRNYLSFCKVPDVVILSDYNKGFFNADFHFADNFPNSITIVDPKSKEIEKWRNCTIFKPNAKEARDLSGLTDWKEQCKFFVDKINCKSVIITFSGNGIKGWYDGEFFEYNPEYAISQVHSVIGAGDCFAAFLALASAHNYNPIEAAKIAYHAGLIYVREKFNRPIVLAELSDTKIVQPEDLASRDFELVFTNGCFDILHTGHIETLKFAKSKGQKLVVGVNSDSSIKKLKGNHRPIVNLEHRLANLSSLSMVDFVIPFDDLTPIELIKKIKPDYLVKGADYANLEVAGQEFVKQVFFAPIIADFSTTKIIENTQLLNNENL
jgi:D-beta-D-heptose 7-phosphate kinase/D-beta-D-heptose 1-phosphate adenosyltransferase